MKTQDDLFKFFAKLQIETQTYPHPAVATVEAAKTELAHIPGGHCKNLFLCDKKKKYFVLVVALDQTAINLKELSIKLANKKRFSFANAELLKYYLGVTPGSVTPFALFNDTAKHIQVVLDANLFQHDLLNFHPLINTATTAIKTNDFKKFILACGHDFEIVEF